MSTVIAKVASVDGSFYIKSEDGSFKKLDRGDEIHEGSIVVGDKGNNALNSIIVSTVDGPDIVMLGNESQLFDASLSQREFSKDDTVSDTKSIEAMIANDTSLISDDINTEAGEEDERESTTDVNQAFAQISDEGVDVNANLRNQGIARNTEIPVDENNKENTDILNITVQPKK